MSENPEYSSHQLIDGEFSAEEANTILMALIDNKIRFHHREKFQQQERHGHPGNDSHHRIEQLLQTKEDLSAVIDSARGEGERLSINCVIEITRVTE